MSSLDILHQDISALRAENKLDHTSIETKIDKVSDRLRKVEIKTVGIAITVASLFSAGVTAIAEWLK